MLHPRIIPCLLLKDKGLVKTVNFKNPTYVGDPINAVKIFNEKSVDELIIMDIDLSSKKLEPNYELISYIAMESRMPLCYGGGIKNSAQALKILSLGVEKVAISSSAFKNSLIIKEISQKTGKQSVVVVIDVKKRKFFDGYDIYINNGNIKLDTDLYTAIKNFEELGCGEILINFIHKDGLMNGYDEKLIKDLISFVSVPLTVLGGAGQLSDMGNIIQSCGILGIAAGSLFVFKGKYRAVLINYPDADTKLKLIKENFKIYEANFPKF